MANLIDLRKREYDARQAALAWRREVFEHGKSEQTDALFAAEMALADLSAERAKAEQAETVPAGDFVGGVGQLKLLGPQTTKLEARVDLGLAQVPTALVHLFDEATQPLVTFSVKNLDSKTRRLGFRTFVEGYSAQAVATLEIEQGKEVKVGQLPTFFGDRLRTVTELTRATVNVEIRDIDAKTELQKTLPIWLLARTSVPLQVLDAASGVLRDMTPYLGALVTPNQPDVLLFARTVADTHPQGHLIGYQADESAVEPQVQAAFDALKKHELRYVNSVIDFTPENGSQHQRVRLPRETLADKAGNCIDVSLLLCSLLEAISLNPAIVIIPGHAFVGWETWAGSDKWRYLEATLIPKAMFLEAVASGEATASTWSKKAQTEARPEMFRRWSLRELRARGITPLE
jgi:hypothetical protein